MPYTEVHTCLHIPAENDQELSNDVALLDIGALAQVMGFIVMPLSLFIAPLLWCYSIGLITEEDNDKKEGISTTCHFCNPSIAEFEPFYA